MKQLLERCEDKGLINSSWQKIEKDIIKQKVLEASKILKIDDMIKKGFWMNLISIFILYLLSYLPYILSELL